MNYVDAGYAVALTVLFFYGSGLVLRRRRWERAQKVVQQDRRAARPTLVTSTLNEPGASAAPSTAVVREGPALPRVRRRSSKRLWLVFAVLLAALVYLLVQGLGSSLNFFDTVDQAFAHRVTLGTKTFNLEGDVVAGSIHSTTVGTNFTISEGARTVAVVNTGSPPQLFQVNIPVVVIGHFTTDTSHTFVSHQILVKHSANYIAEHPNRVKTKNGTHLP